jgi:uncharacterized protein YjbI with pentapeptide repeats
VTGSTSTALKKLASGLQAWNAYRSGAKDRIRLSDVNLSGRSFQQFDLNNTDFLRCNFRDTDFAGANLEGCSFSECGLRNTVFSGARLAGSDFSNESLDGCHFSGARAIGMTLRGSTLRSCKFVEANLSKADLGMAHIEQSEFRAAKMKQVVAHGATLVDSDFSSADMSDSELVDCDIARCILSTATLSKSRVDRSRWTQCTLHGVDASNVSANGAQFDDCNFRRAVLDGLIACNVQFKRGSLAQTNLIASRWDSAVLDGVRMEYALLCKAKLTDTRIVDCHVFGISCWGTDFSRCIQQSIRAYATGSYSIHVNSIEYSFFLYQCMENRHFKTLFESTTDKLVLILGRFSEDAVSGVEALRSAVTRCGLIPVVFDFEKPDAHDLTEVVLSLALLSRFIVVDLSDPKCTPHEIASMAPHINRPVASVIRSGQRPYAMFSDMSDRYRWVLPPVSYNSLAEISRIVEEQVIPSCEEYIAARDSSLGRRG